MPADPRALPPVPPGAAGRGAALPRGAGRRGSSLAWGLVRALRPRQWVKNFLVFAAPLAAGAVFDPDVLRPSLVAFVLFCVASSAVYLVNDTIDVEDDRRHPRKRFRPIAAGIVPRWLAARRWPSCSSPSPSPRRRCSPGRSWRGCWRATSSSSSPIAWG